MDCPLRLLRCQEVRRPPMSPAWASWNQGSPALELRGKEVLTGAQRDALPPLQALFPSSCFLLPSVPVEPPTPHPHPDPISST